MILYISLTLHMGVMPWIIFHSIRMKPSSGWSHQTKIGLQVFNHLSGTTHWSALFRTWSPYVQMPVFFILIFILILCTDCSSRGAWWAVFPVSTIHAEPEDIGTLQAGEAPGRRDLRESHVSGAQEERSVAILSTAPSLLVLVMYR